MCTSRLPALQRNGHILAGLGEAAERVPPRLPRLLLVLYMCDVDSALILTPARAE